MDATSAPLPATRLALDCSFAGLALALRVNGGKTYVFSTAAARSSDLLPTELHSLFNQSGTSARHLTHVYVTTGPGSFTGIRLGLATAEALRLVNPSLEVIGLSTLRALAQQIATENNPQTAFTLLLDAAGGQAHTQTFAPNGEAQTPATCQPIAKLPPGTLYAQSSLLLDAKPLATFDATHLFTLAEDPANHLPATPVYLKPLTYKRVPE